jgi:hypothetical protein
MVKPTKRRHDSDEESNTSFHDPEQSNRVSKRQKIGGERDPLTETPNGTHAKNGKKLVESEGEEEDGEQEGEEFEQDENEMAEVTQGVQRLRDMEVRKSGVRPDSQIYHTGSLVWAIVTITTRRRF